MDHRGRRTSFLLAFVIFLTALGVRLVYQGVSEVDTPIRADAARYHRTALNLAEHGILSIERTSSGAPPVSRTIDPPLYPLLLSAVMSTAADDPTLLARMGMLQALMGALTAVVTFLLARCALTAPWAAGAALGAALSPHAIALEQNLLQEASFTLVLVLAALGLVEGRRRGSLLLLALAGAGFGLAHGIREASLLLGVALAPLLFLDPSVRRIESGGLRRFGAFALGHALVSLAILVPVHAGARGHPIVRAYTLWEHVFQGSYPLAVHDFQPWTREPDHVALSKDPSRGAARILHRLRHEPRRVLGWYVGGKVMHAWSWTDEYNGDVYPYPMKRAGFRESAPLRAIAEVERRLHTPMLFLAMGLVPLWLLRRRTASPSDLEPVLLVVLAYFALLFTLVIPVSRYSVPLRPYAWIAAAVTASTLLAAMLRPTHLKSR